MADPVSLEEFAAILARRFEKVLAGQGDVAVGVSGGPDSMALVQLLSDWAAGSNGPQIHALIVDHGLRPESAKEAGGVTSSLKGLRYVKLNILEWAGEKPEAGLQEEARRARYALMEAYCQANGIKYLFLAHHQNDQAETFLFRLAKGSGLDGLAAMQDQQARGGLTLLRPLLEIPKARLIATCEAQGLDYVQDPSNESDKFARVRLRGSMEVLAEEGLSVKRLAVTAARLSRARQALEKITQQAAKAIILESNTNRYVLDYKLLTGQPAEIALRVILQGFEALRPDADYAPRMEKIEALFEDLMTAAPFRKRTLGGLVIERDDQAGRVIIEKEN